MRAVISILIYVQAGPQMSRTTESYKAYAIDIREGSTKFLHFPHICKRLHSIKHGRLSSQAKFS